ncbi:hypothetical protein AB4Z34_21775 [Ensifer sp. 2YAB10]|uniref:hypothetical protein n=1 Tax=unclassified Ensifer TaxID=2633371 RepID=UPI003F915F7D
MPRAAKPPHLVWIKPKHDKVTGKLVSNGYWAIKHRTKLTSTSLGYEHRDEAEKKRLEYEVALYATERRPTVGEPGTSVREVQITDLISFYLERNKEKIEAKRPDRLRDYLNSVERLIKFWGGKVVYDITEENCQGYQKTARPSKPLANDTAKRELEDLKAMVMLGIRKRLVAMDGHIIDWWFPSKSRPRYTHYSRDEVAHLVWTTYRRKNMAIGTEGHKTSVHLARFILVAARTGTRADRIERASFVDIPGRPWLDLHAGIDEYGEPYGIFYRAGDGERVPDNKQADACRIPKGLRAHMIRWAKEGDDLIAHNGKVGSTKKSFYNLKTEIFDEKRAKKVNRHTLKHTAATWYLRDGVSLRVVANYLSTTEEVIERVYGKHHPGWHAEIDAAMSSAREERKKSRKAAQAKADKKAA